MTKMTYNPLIGPHIILLDPTHIIRAQNLNVLVSKFKCFGPKHVICDTFDNF